MPEIDRARVNKMAITEDAEPPSIAGALDAAPRFGLPPAEARRILGEVFVAVSGWRKTGLRLGIRPTTLDAYASAFEQPLMEEAGGLVVGDQRSVSSGNVA